MNNYLTKTVVYFTYQQFLNELEELKKKYYIIGYTVKSQENAAECSASRKISEKRKRKMEKLYLVKLGNMYVTSASLTSIKLDETVEKAKVFKNVVEAESIANTLGAIVITFVSED